MRLSFFALLAALWAIVLIPGMNPALAETTVLVVDGVGSPGIDPAADLLSVTLQHNADQAPHLRISFLSLGDDAWSVLGHPGDQKNDRESVTVTLRHLVDGSAPRLMTQIDLAKVDGRFHVQASSEEKGKRWWQNDNDPDAIFLALDSDPSLTATLENPWKLQIETSSESKGLVDQIVASLPAAKDYQAHCAFVLHGNQGLGYSDVFHGRSEDLEGSGFDETLQVHQNLGVPGNFHLSGTLQTSAEWSAQNGDPVDFNAWLAAGVTEGWAGMITSAYAQHIMPFVNDDMNNWAVHTETDMIDHRYGYQSTVGWVPERVWLNTSGYPSSGVNDWIGDNWQTHGVNGVILDDDVHLAGHDNHRIHTLSGNGLRLIPRDRNFTGNIIGGNGQAALDILTGLAGGGFGQYRIAVFAEDWEAASEMGGWASIVPNAVETYEWMINKCATESAWLHTWKLADALVNPDFNGDTILVSPGTYWEIGGTDGYGGGDNGWYTHWAGWVPFANGGDGNGNCAGSGNCKNYGTLWNDAYNALMAAPDNNISQAGWYVMMTNLYETGWHDGMGGDISGWEHNYSAHIKNAMVYAEAAHWAAGQYALDVNAYFSDIDNDGYDECIIHNSSVFGVIEGIGGRMTHVFTRDAGGHVVIGVDNAYWSGTNADYNDDNHVGAFSDVSPNYKNDLYDLEILEMTTTRAVVRMTHAEVTRDVAVDLSSSFFDVVYRVGPSAHWWQSGFSPSLVDLIWNAQMDRVWDPGTGHMGWRNPNTGVAAGWLVGTGGAAHQRDFSGTLMKGDELTGAGTMQMRLFAGYDPDGSIMASLASAVEDTLGPLPVAVTIMAGTSQIRFNYDQATVPGSFGPGEVLIGGIDLNTATAAAGAASYSVTYDVPQSIIDALLQLESPVLILTMNAGVVEDEGGVFNRAVTAADQITVGVVTANLSIDGNIDPTEWEDALVLDDADDSVWSSSNEIDRLLVQWDANFLYIAIDGQVSSNSWLLYLDVDPGAGTGEADLTAIDAWERGATFSYPNAGVDFQYGCYQHQSAFDGDGFWKILGPATTQDISGEIESGYDSFHLNGSTSGSELAIPWNTLYGLGEGHVPVGAQVSLVASITWDPDPDGELGGDSAPSNLAASLPDIDNVWTIDLDADGNGIPDGTVVSAVPSLADGLPRLLPNVPNPFNPSTRINFEIPGSAIAKVEVSIFDLRGRRISTLVRGDLEPGLHSVTWNGQTDGNSPVAAGTYFCQFRCLGQVQTRPLSLVK
jgi:FlgD Ig-like domain